MTTSQTLFQFFFDMFECKKKSFLNYSINQFIIFNDAIKNKSITNNFRLFIYIFVRHFKILTNKFDDKTLFTIEKQLKFF